MQEFSLLSSPMRPHLERLISGCSSRLMIASPYIKKSAIQWLAATKPPSLQEISVLTNLSIESILSRSLEMAALREVFASFKNVSIMSLQHLHAKIFVADERTALITSANFTTGGLLTNYEYGILIRHQPIVDNIMQDVIAYQRLGGIVTLDLLDKIEDNVAELTTVQNQAESNPSTKALRRKAREFQIALQDILLSNRVSQGRTINRIFSDTILLILTKHSEGMTTQQIHSEIRSIHPDICDDSIDRVINGQHFGKKWKHHVRRAQEFLKGRNIIANASGIWRLKDYAFSNPLPSD